MHRLECPCTVMAPALVSKKPSDGHGAYISTSILHKAHISLFRVLRLQLRSSNPGSVRFRRAVYEVRLCADSNVVSAMISVCTAARQQ